MSNLKRLKEITDMIEQATNGRQQLVADLPGGVGVLTDRSAYTDLLLRKQTDLHTGEISLSFQATFRRMGNWMSAGEFQTAAGEVQEMGNLLYELEQATVTVSPEEMQQWSDWLADRQQEQQQMDESTPGMEMS